tara:strand:- start:35 stop:1486 length:1452 start_codon:yes stop_codon:yes gene_type:complete
MNVFADTVTEAHAASRDNFGFTFNGMATRTSSLNVNVDLFAAIGSSRGKDITGLFANAYRHNPELAVRTLLWARDIRGGAGERQTFRDCFNTLVSLDMDQAIALVPFVPFFGRWDDLLEIKDQRVLAVAYGEIHRALQADDALCAKWMPRKGPVAAQLRRNLGMSPKVYRNRIVALTHVVETDMCAKNWNEIDFGKLPSVAAARYKKAFGRNAREAYTAYIERLTNGTDKINAGAVYPYDVLKGLMDGWGGNTYVEDEAVYQAQWDALPNYLSDNRVLPMVDVSGSMADTVGGNKNLSCLDVAVSLGLYVADKQSGAFSDLVLTFSGSPVLERLTGNIIQKMTKVARGHWDMNTSIKKAMDAVLDHAVKNNVPAEEMPDMLLIMSDMEFDRCAAHGWNLTAMEMFKVQFARAGYDLPKVVFWNLNARQGNTPVAHDEAGTALVSGFNVHILKSLLAAKDFSPETIMLETIMSERYNTVQPLAA